MFFKIALRNLLKRKVFAIINIAGLAIGLSACLLIYLYIKDELSYDQSYKDAERIYRIARVHGEGDEKRGSATINYTLGNLIKENNVDFEVYTRFSFPVEIKVEAEKKTFREKGAHYADQQFFDAFSIPFLHGNKEDALSRPFTVVLNDAVAKKLFNDANPIGQSITIDNKNYEITGVVNDLPEKSHFHFNYLISLQSTRSFYSQEMFESWGNVWLYNYVKLKPEVDDSRFEKEVNAIATEHGPSALKDFGVRFFLQPVTDIHLHSQLSSELAQNGDITVLKILAAVALLILLIACFNFINLTTARSAWRSKEVGVKKVLGVKRGELIRQFLGESLMITGIAFLVCLIIVGITLPFFNLFAGKALTFTEMMFALPAALAVVLVVGLVAGAIPSVFLSSFKPVKMLKGQSSQGDSHLAKLLRQILIVFQFSIAVLLIVGSMVIFYQLDYIKSKDLGVDISQVIVLPLNNKEVRQTREAMMNELSRLPDVEKVSLASQMPFERLNSWRVKPKGVETPFELISVVAIDENYIQSLNIRLTDESPVSAASMQQKKGILVNEAFVKHFLITDPVGAQVNIGHEEDPITITGVVKDFHFASLHESIRPLMLSPRKDWFRNVMIKASSESYEKLLAGIKSVWSETNPAEPFEYYFLNQQFEELYASEEQTATLVSYFSILSIFIACLGLYGLAAFVAEAKTKEISVRKVMGAGIGHLVKLQFSVFLRLILIAGLIALPLSYFLMNNWLQQFAYRIQIPWWIMVVALMVVFLFTIISVGYRSLRAAQLNPVDNLRNE
ncbi:MAG: ABC transporter permease [Fulvivirga sp.]|nr:ABC transporter permease [Fulvivirga sp.]